MPRRPRPALRGRPKEEGPVVNVASSSKAKLPLAKVASKRKMEAVDSEPDLDEEEREDNDGDEGPSSESDEEDSDLPGDLSEDEESDVNMDAPRVAQWVDEEDLERAETVSGDASHENTVNPEDIVRFLYLPLSYERFVIYCVPSHTQETVRDSEANNNLAKDCLSLHPPSRLGFVTARCSAACAACSR